MITTVLCDLDGTLVNSARDIAQAFQHALCLVTCEAPPARQLIAQHIGKPLDAMAYELGYVFSEKQLSFFLDAYRRYYAAHCVRYTRPYPGVEATLGRLSGTTLGIVTTKQQEQAEAIVHQLNLAVHFQHIQGGLPDLRSKPAPDLVQAALKALRCSPEEVLMVGDTTADIQAGQAAGVQTCAVTYGFGSADELRRERPDYLIRAFEDLLGIV